MEAVADDQCTFNALGTFATLIVADPAVLAAAREILARELAAIDAACSRFRPDSELMRVCAAAGRPVQVSPLFAEAMSVAIAAARLTDGDVDPTCGRALISLGYDRDFGAARESARQQVRRPSESPVPGSGWCDIALDAGRLSLTVPKGVLLDLGATAKALAADRAAARISAATGSGALVNLGGDVSVAGQSPARGWLVGVADDASFDTTTATVEQRQVVYIRDGGLATSSVLGRAWQRAGERLHHIIDPRSGLSAPSCWRTVTVAAASCVDANIASTAAIIRGECAAAWLEGLGLPARLVRHDGTVVAVAGWPGQEGSA